MAAVLKEDDQMEGQMGRLESDVSFIRSDFGEMKLDLRALATTVADQRAEMQTGLMGAHAAIADVRLSLEKSYASLREAIVTGDAKSAEALADFRQETVAAMADLRVEMVKGDSALRDRIEKLALSHYIQTVTLGIGLLTLIARAFKWI